MTKKVIGQIVLMWLLWAALVIGFQAFASARFQPQIPDTVLEWTKGETQPGAHATQPYLLEPFLNQQVAYDSEFYISIALNGYDDPNLRAIWLDPAQKPEPIWGKSPLPFGIPNSFPGGRPPGIPAHYTAYSLNYAFFPFYPLLMRAVMAPLAVFGMNPIATAALAGVVVSLLGALGGMLALYSLARPRLQHAGAFKAAFYLAVFPTGFFLAMVHTEGLFVGLAFGALALLERKKWAWAALLAACATLTRAVGGALILPFAAAWLAEAAPYFTPGPRTAPVPSARGLILKGGLALAPLAAFALWNALLGQPFHAVEAAFFSRGTLEIAKSFEVWNNTFLALFGAKTLGLAQGLVAGIITLTALLTARALNRQRLAAFHARWAVHLLDLLLAGFALLLAGLWFANTRNEQRSVYYMVECAATILTLTACAYTFRAHPGLALFSLAVVGISFFSGVAQGMHRYILGAPVVFLMLAELGSQDDIFDRVWTTASVLLMGLFALLFAANFWVG